MNADNSIPWEDVDALRAMKQHLEQLGSYPGWKTFLRALDGDAKVVIAKMGMEYEPHKVAHLKGQLCLYEDMKTWRERTHRILSDRIETLDAIKERKHHHA